MCVCVCVCVSDVCGMCVYYIYYIVDGHLSCFHVLAIVNSAAMNIGVHISFRIRVLVFSGYMPRSGIAGFMVTLFLVF